MPRGWNDERAADAALAWAADLRQAVVDDKAKARALVLAKAEYETAEYATEIIIRDKARALLRAVGQAIRTGKIPAKWDNPDSVGELSSKGLTNYDPRLAFQAALRSALEAGRLERMDRDPAIAYKVYRTMGDDRVRQAHAALDRLTLPKDDPRWAGLSPPLDPRCRCRTEGLTVAAVERAERKGVRLQREVPELEMVTRKHKVTGEVTTLPKGVAPGWGFVPGTESNKAALVRALVQRERILMEADLADM